MTDNIERRFTSHVVELRADDSRKRIGGYAAVFNRSSHNLGGFVEEVNTSAFNKSRGDGWPDVMARFQHDNNMLLGTTAAGTLELQVDKRGLYYVVDPPKSRADVLELVERQDVRQSSFAFNTPQGGDDWGMTDAGFPKRTLLSVRLIDVAPVIGPAYPDATAGLRSLAHKFEAELEEVRSLAEQNELRKFFVRTDGPKAPVKPAAEVAKKNEIAHLRMQLLEKQRFSID
ncbi:HK97 family phage prohead protease [Micromonospora sp. CPCC 206171]|uniref:HK97 family phage prohead protease n=1 Tax=Micromonospora sp. CPCC 206171 TaxID=3122405 RepID=UPI002FF40318